MSANPTTITAPAERRNTKPFPRVAVAVTVFSVLGALILSYIGTNVWSSFQQRALERRFDAAAARWHAMDPVDRSAVTYTTGAPIARLVIPSIGLDAIVAEGATPSIMRGAPGHLDASATPGENGVAIITANRIGFGSFFLRLDRLEIGDRIEIETAIGRTVFEVESVKVVPADQMELGVDSTERELLLFGSARLLGGPDRLVIRALAADGVTQ